MRNMNQNQMGVAVFLALLIAAGWLAVPGGRASQAAEQAGTLETARQYRDQELYERSIQSYGQALLEGASLELYQELEGVYETYYAENPTSAVRRDFAAMLSSACEAYPDEVSFWERYAALYLDTESYAEAWNVLRDAREAGGSSETLETQYRQAYYAYRLNYQPYVEILPQGWPGGYIVRDGELWGAVTASGDTLLSPVYRMAGPLSEDGSIAVADADGDTWLIDGGGIPAAHYPGTAEQAGSHADGLIPIKMQGKDVWGYYTDDGQEVLSGYLEAGSFQDGLAAVCTGEGWSIIDEDGVYASDEVWEEIRLDAAGRYDQDGVILAKSGGAWHIYDDEFEQAGDFSCEEIDVHIDGPIAFCRSGLWGFADEDGNEVIAPAYEQARSFSGGVAAVCRDGLWGFIDESGQTVIDFLFTDAGYFSASDGSCPVQLEEGGAYRLIQWEVAR